MRILVVYEKVFLFFSILGSMTLCSSTSMRWEILSACPNSFASSSIALWMGSPAFSDRTVGVGG